MTPAAPTPPGGIGRTPAGPTPPGGIGRTPAALTPPGGIGRAPAALAPPERLLRLAELRFSRRLDGLWPGAHRSLRLGEGMELADLRPYVPGDDVRAIDWAVTARTGLPHVRVYEADRRATALVVADRSASMAFGTARWTKEALARELVAALAVLVLRRGDRLGALLFAGRTLAGLPPGGGRRAALRLLRLFDDHPPVPRAPSRLDLALQEAERVLRRRSIVLVVSDFLDAGAWPQPLRRLAARHGVIAAEVRDPREDALPAVGPLVLEDPETGRQLEVDTSRRGMAEAFARAAARRRAEVARAITAAGAGHLVVSTDRDWAADLLRFLDRLRRGRR